MKILKFYSNSCGPCKIVDENLKKANVEFTPIDVEDEKNDDLVDKYSIRDIPTLIKLNDKEEVIAKHTGYMTVEQLVNWCKE